MCTLARASKIGYYHHSEFCSLCLSFSPFFTRCQVTGKRKVKWNRNSAKEYCAVRPSDNPMPQLEPSGVVRVVLEIRQVWLGGAPKLRHS